MESPIAQSGGGQRGRLSHASSTPEYEQAHVVAALAAVAAATAAAFRAAASAASVDSPSGIDGCVVLPISPSSALPGGETVER